MPPGAKQAAAGGKLSGEGLRVWGRCLPRGGGTFTRGRPPGRGGGAGPGAAPEVKPLSDGQLRGPVGRSPAGSSARGVHQAGRLQ